MATLPGHKLSDVGHNSNKGTQDFDLPPESRDLKTGDDPAENVESDVRARPQQIPGFLPGDGPYYSFSFVRRNMIENLPEPIRGGLKTSNSWRGEEESGGLAVTNCLSLYMSEKSEEDALLIVRVGYHHGWSMANLFGFGEFDSPE